VYVVWGAYRATAGFASGKTFVFSLELFHAHLQGPANEPPHKGESRGRGERKEGSVKNGEESKETGQQRDRTDRHQPWPRWAGEQSPSLSEKTHGVAVQAASHTTVVCSSSGGASPPTAAEAATTIAVHRNAVETHVENTGPSSPAGDGLRIGVEGESVAAISLPRIGRRRRGAKYLQIARLHIICDVAPSSRTHHSSAPYPMDRYQRSIYTNLTTVRTHTQQCAQCAQTHARTHARTHAHRTHCSVVLHGWRYRRHCQP
jgi:hypothetical protein